VTSHVGKGGMAADGKQIRTCKLHLQRIQACYDLAASAAGLASVASIQCP
jgi:hypothetical protein